MVCWKLCYCICMYGKMRLEFRKRLYLIDNSSSKRLSYRH